VELSTPPVPRPDADTAGYWELADRGTLHLARCRDCRRWQHPPLERCRSCGSPLAFEPVSGRATLFSWTVTHQPCVPGYLDDLPYTVAVVELAEQEGLRIVGRADGDVVAAGAGAPVRAKLEPLGAGGHMVPRIVAEAEARVSAAGPARRPDPGP
jgi:hypothetical protein